MATELRHPSRAPDNRIVGMFVTSGWTRDQVRLVSGPNVFIFDECVDLGADVLKDGSDDPRITVNRSSKIQTLNTMATAGSTTTISGWETLNGPDSGRWLAGGHRRPLLRGGERHLGLGGSRGVQPLNDRAQSCLLGRLVVGRSTTEGGLSGPGIPQFDCGLASDGPPKHHRAPSHRCEGRKEDPP